MISAVNASMINTQNFLLKWTVAQRPLQPSAGTYGFNSELNIIERWSGIKWERISGGRRGDIKFWSGATTDIEAGWILCDGIQRNHPEGGTITPPNLRDKFLVGAGTTYSVGATGGEATHILTIAEIPNHSHTVPSAGVVPGSGISGGDNLGATASRTTSAIGGDTAHNNMPPYYAMCYLMKL